MQRIPLVSKLKTTKKRDFNTHFDHEMASTTVNKGHLTQKNLIYSYVKLITYCHRGSPQYYLHQHRRPIELLLELEKLNDLIENDSYGDDINRIKENLARIVFGKKIPISRSLVSAWSVICLWVQQGISPVNSRKTLENDEWVCFGTTAYSVAKRLSGIVN